MVSCQALQLLSHSLCRASRSWPPRFGSDVGTTSILTNQQSASHPDKAPSGAWMLDPSVQNRRRDAAETWTSSKGTRARLKLQITSATYGKIGSDQPARHPISAFLAGDFIRSFVLKHSLFSRILYIREGCSANILADKRNVDQH